MEAIRAVLAGKVYLSEEMSVKIVSRVFGEDGKQAGRSPVDALTDREQVFHHSPLPSFP